MKLFLFILETGDYYDQSRSFIVRADQGEAQARALLEQHFNDMKQEQPEPHAVHVEEMELYEGLVREL